MQNKNLEYFIEKNLQFRPRFFAYIRSQEGLLFTKYAQFIKSKSLDFGCGDGFFAETVFGRKTIDIGLDVPSSRMQIAERNSVYKRIIAYNGSKIPLRPSSLKTVVSNCVFEHIPHIEKSVQEIYSVLRPGGYLLTSVMCSPWSTNLSGAKWGGLAYVKWFNQIQEHNALYSKKQWISLFRKSGFSIEVSEDYLFKKASQKTEIFHYLSVPSLLLYKLTGKWTLGIKPHHKEINEIRDIILSDKHHPSACFFVLKKKERYRKN